MKTVICLVLVLLLFASAVSAQENDKLADLQAAFELFEYEKVIKSAEELLAEKTLFSQEELITIFTYKAIAHYSLGDNNFSKDTFIEILNLDENHELDPAAVSPKIISVYEELKRDYKQIVPPEELEIEPSRIDTVVRVDTVFVPQNNGGAAGHLLKSIALPGWGHISTGEKTKGWLLTSASALTLGSMVFFIIDANTKRSSYLNELDQNLIDQKYDKFNTSYKIRNTLIAAYVALWIYSQLDLMVFSSELLSPPPRTSSFYYQSQIPSEIQFQVTIPF